MIRFFLFLIGFGFSLIGFMYIILYLNYLTIGYTVLEYLGFIIKRFECILAGIGVILIMIALFKKETK